MIRQEDPSLAAETDTLKASTVEAGSPGYITPAERAALGKAARVKVPRAEQAVWEPAAGRPDPIALLEAQAETRIPELIPIRYGRMLTSPFAFYRGAAAIMACDLASTANTGLRVQLCGDAHLSNFGGFGSPERKMVFDINDFDETLPGPWEWDVKRLAASIEIAGRERGFSAKQRRAIVLASVGEYRRAMLEFASMRGLEVWYALLDAAKIQARWGQLKDAKKIEVGFTAAQTKDNLRALEKLTRRTGNRLRIVSHPPLIVPIEELFPAETDQLQTEQLMKEYLLAYRKTLPDDRRRLLEQYRFEDMARKVVGVGSVGLRAWIILLVGRDDQDVLFLQCKEAQASVLEAYLGKSRFLDHGRRVVEGQHMMQSVSDILLGWERAPQGLDSQPRDYYIRQLSDWKLSADVESMSPQGLTIYAEMCAWTLARAHARTGDRIAMSAYLGKSDAFDQALADFSSAYADQNQRDYQALVKAVKSGRIKAETDV